MAEQGVSIGRWIGRRIPAVIARRLILPLFRRFTPGVYADAIKIAEAERSDGREVGQ